MKRLIVECGASQESHRFFVITHGPGLGHKRTLRCVSVYVAHAIVSIRHEKQQKHIKHTTQCSRLTCCATGDPSGDGLRALAAADAPPPSAPAPPCPILLCGLGGAGAQEGSSKLSSTPDVGPPHLMPSVPPKVAPLSQPLLLPPPPPPCTAATEAGRGGR